MKKHFLQISLSLLVCVLYVSEANAQSVQERKVRTDSAVNGTGIHFSVDFESGCLDSVAVANGLDFDIYSRLDPVNPVDTALPPSGRWFYFLMHGTKDKSIGLRFYRTDPKRPFYSYNGVDFHRYSEDEVAGKRFVKRTFTEDSVYIAYFVPYTKSYLDKKIAEWSGKSCVEVSSIGKSEHGREMELLKITDPDGNAGKKTIYIHGRIHPSESPASWHLSSMIDLLVSDNEYASALRKNAVFYILPFTNPDGVQEGMSRSNGEGINLEINWNRPEEQTALEVKNMKAFLNKILDEKGKIDIVLNMHSQSSDFCTYWIHDAKSTSKEFYRMQLLMANLTINGNPYFKKNDLSFSKIAPRYVEGWFWDRFKNKTLMLCYETPYTYYNRDSSGEWVSLANLDSMAIYNIKAIGDYLGISSYGRILIDLPAKGKSCSKKSDNKHVYFGSRYFVARNKNSEVTYSAEMVPSGRYSVYMWQTGECLTESREDENEWIKRSEFIQEESGPASITVKAQDKGDKFSTILLVREQ